MSAFLVNGNLLTDRNVIRDMWADHFEALGTPTENKYFDNAFLSRVVSGVREIFDSCTNNPFGVLCEPLDYDEVVCVCSKLKLGVTRLTNRRASVRRALVEVGHGSSSIYPTYPRLSLNHPRLS